jgi:hypothetical protein
MNWNWQIFLVVILLNTKLCLGQFVAQKIDKKNKRIPQRHSIISGTEQKFLYWEDFYTQTYGDILGLTWIMNTFAHLLVNEKIGWHLWIVFIAVLFTTTIAFLSTHLNHDRKPDWGFPKNGNISLGGISHLSYFSLNSGMATICLLEMLRGELSGILLWTALSGLLIWILSAMADYYAGHFDKPKKKVLKFYS